MKKQAALKKYFGYETFYPLQAEIIDHVLAGKNALVLMPTGGGKYVCFQIPALLREGTAIVLLPLIALMKDQVDALRANGIAAAFLNSTQTDEESAGIVGLCLQGGVKLLYISPERLAAASTIGLLQKLRLSLCAVDEAHCISSWGHDFRPDYLKLNTLRKNFPDIPLITLTATADRAIRNDILRQLEIPEEHQFVASFDRPNLSLAVYSERKRLEQILSFLSRRKNQPGIIYCLSCKMTENLSAKLRDRGYRAACYHAGMDNGARSKIQDAFIRDKIQIICATIAFGLGIDKSNIRWIVHYSLPKNIESYYQEIGRAGRDGAPADTVLFYSYADVKTHHDMIGSAPQDRQELLLAKLERIKNYARIKTFGVGRDISYNDWTDYIYQLLNYGFVDIAYDDGYTLKLNELSRKILKAQM